MTLRWYGDEIKRRARAAAARALDQAAEYVLEVANRTVPHETGQLQDSGDTSLDRQRLIAHVHYDTPYARYQHERLDLRHKPGRRAKWLEKTLQEEANAVRSFIEREIRNALGG